MLEIAKSGKPKWPVAKEGVHCDLGVQSSENEQTQVTCCNADAAH